MILVAFVFSLVYFQIGVIPSVQASPATITLEPIADSYVEYHEPNTNYGASSGIDVWKSSSGNYNRHTYLKFDLSSIPSNATINSAELKLYLWGNVSETSSIGAHYVSSNTWTELGITWNSAPSYRATPTYTVSQVAFEGWYTWVITGDVQTALSERVLSVALVPGTPCDLCSFYSKDAYYAENRPKLIISYTAPKASSSISCSTSSSSIASGESITVSGSISPPHSDVSVILTYTRPNGTLVTKTVNATAGSYSDTYVLDMAGAWNVRASWEGDEDHLGATSSTVSFTVKAPSAVSCSVSPTSIVVGQTVTVSGLITPARSGATVTLTYTRPDGTIFTRTIATTTDSSYAYNYTPDQTGTWKVKAGWLGDENYAGSESLLISFSVTPAPTTTPTTTTTTSPMTTTSPTTSPTTTTTSPTTTTTPSTPPPETPYAIYAGVISIVIVIVGLVAYFLIRR